MAKHINQSVIYISAILLLVFTTLQEPLAVVSITDSNVLVATLSSTNDISGFVLNLHVGTPPQKLPLLLDVQSPFTTIRCTNADLNSSSSFHPSLSSTFLAPSSTPDICVAPPPAPSHETCTCAQDTVNLYIERTEFPDPLLSANVSAVNFTCCSELQSSGVAGLSKGDRSLAAQISKSGGLARQFSYCLPSIAFFGRVTTYALLNAPVGQMESFTPSLKTRLYYVKGGGYAFKVQNMSMGGEFGVMGRAIKMRVSTTQMYTTLERKVYKELRASFRKAVGYGKGVKAVSAIEPFDTCFDTTPLYAQERYPYLQGPTVFVEVEGGSGWTWYPRSTFVYNGSSSAVACMGFLKAEPGQPSVLGTFQQLDCLAEFDLEDSRFGFRSIFDPFSIHPEAPDCHSVQYPMYPSA